VSLQLTSQLYLIASFVNIEFINKCEFIKNNKIISIKEIKSLMPYDFNTLNSQSLSDCQILKLMELYENYLDNLIIKYMHKYGIENVRGGSFSDEILTETQIQQINKIKDKFNGKYQINGESSVEFDEKIITKTLDKAIRTMSKGI
jgi:hypothetical protein